jgi:hypothetical protein
LSCGLWILQYPVDSVVDKVGDTWAAADTVLRDYIVRRESAVTWNFGDCYRAEPIQVEGRRGRHIGPIVRWRKQNLSTYRQG